MSQKRIEVSAAIIYQQNRILATERGYGDFKGGWEFPGGKVEKGESPEETIIREIREELGIEVKPESLVTTVECDYPDFHLTMHCFYCHIDRGCVQLLEHTAARWLEIKELDSVAWLPADIEAVKALKIFLEEIKR